MPGSVKRRKDKGVGAILTFRYPAHEVETLDASARAAGMTRSHFMYAAIDKEVQRIQRRAAKVEPLQAAS